ncbi:MAG: pfeA [Sporomusa sp.]|jgi:outer membrane receptor protein involved in Fe transport|nr:pfeA [Sporomusa sp.]
MREKKLAVNILLSLALMTTPVYATQPPSFAMEEIIVSADAYKQALDSESINVKVVSPGKATSVPDLLRQVAGIDVQMRATSGDNQDGMVKLRGFDSKRFTVLVDGRPVNMSGVMGGSYADWNAIPLDTVEKIQIIKGAKLAAYGNTMGGVINIITKAHAQNSGDISTFIGENGQYQYRFNYGGRDQRLDWKVYSNKYGADAFLRNNDYDAEQYGFGLNYDLSANDSIKFNWHKVNARRGMIIANDPAAPAGYDPRYPWLPASAADVFAGNVRAEGPGSYWKKDLTMYDAAWTHKTQHGFIALSYWQNDEKKREVNYNAAGVLQFDRTVVTDKSRGWQLTGQETVNKHTYGYGIDYKRYRYGFGWYSAGTGMALTPSQKVDLLGSYIEDTWVLDDRWTGNIGLRYDKMSGRPDTNPSMRSVDYEALSPKMNFSFRNNQDTTTFLSVSRLWRAPSMAEFYWWSQPFPPGKIGIGWDLKPEKGWGYELGVERRMSAKLTSKLTAYYQDIDDYINFTHQPPYSCYNIPNVQVWGFEWESNYKLNSNSLLLFNYTNQHTTKEGVVPTDILGLAGELDYRPRHKASLGYQYDAKPWQLRYTIDYTGHQTANYNDTATTSRVVSIGGYTVHNLSLTRNILIDATITLSVNNIFDKDYVEQYNYPMQGRVFGVSFNQKL